MCIEREQPSTALKSMPAYGALNSSFTVNGAVHDPLTGLDTGFSTENLDSRLINHDDFLLVNNGGSTESVNGTIGYEMQVGMGISANARGKTTGTIAALQKEDIHCTGYCFDGGSTENLGGTAVPGGTSYLSGYAEAVGLDSSTVDVVTCPPCGASLGGDFI